MFERNLQFCIESWCPVFCIKDSVRVFVVSFTNTVEKQNSGPELSSRDEYVFVCVCESCIRGVWVKNNGKILISKMEPVDIIITVVVDVITSSSLPTFLFCNRTQMIDR